MITNSYFHFIKGTYSWLKQKDCNRNLSFLLSQGIISRSSPKGNHSFLYRQARRERDGGRKWERKYHWLIVWISSPKQTGLTLVKTSIHTNNKFCWICSVSKAFECGLAFSNRSKIWFIWPHCAVWARLRQRLRCAQRSGTSQGNHPVQPTCSELQIE